MRPCIPVTALLTFSLTSCAAPWPTQSSAQAVTQAVSGSIALTAMAPGDHLEVHLNSKGCFHDWVADLVFEADAAGKVAVSGRAGFLENLYDHRPPAATSASITATFLERPVLAGLDRVLMGLRAPQGRMRLHDPEELLCTTVSNYHLTLYRGGVLVQEEHLHDSMCSGFPEVDVSFFALVPPGLERGYDPRLFQRAGALPPHEARPI